MTMNQNEERGRQKIVQMCKVLILVGVLLSERQL